MSSSQLARKRLNSLKLLTEQLKDHTKNSPLDLSHIKQILNNSKQLHTSNSHRPPLPDMGTQNEDIPIDSTFKPLFTPSKSLGKEQFHFEEVVKLREQNVALEQTILNLRDQISHLEKEKSKLQQAQQSSNSQYFKLSENLQGFVGRLNIPSDSYDRLEYSGYEVELKLDKIILIRKEKSSFQQFELTTLKQAEYCSGNVFVLRFQEFIDEEHTNLTNVFLKFYSDEHLHKWDLALFANYHIVNSLSEQRLFQKYFRCLKLQRETQNQKQQMKMMKQSEQLQPSKEKDLLKLLIQKRQQYLQVKKLIDIKLQQKIKSNIALNKEQLQFIEPKSQPTSDFKKVPHPSQSSKKPNISSPIQKIDELEPHQQESQQVKQPLSHTNNKLQIKHTQSNTLNIKEFPTSPLYNYPNPSLSTSSKPSFISSQKIGNSSIKGHFPLSPPPLTTSSVAQSQLRQSKASIVNQLNNAEGRTISYQSSERNNSASKFKQMAQDKLNNARMKLQNGYYATKYSKDGFSPHEKKVFLSLDGRKFCWSQRDKSSQYKSVPIAVIIGVEYGVVGEGIIKHVKDPDSRYFCVIQYYYTSEYKKKTIELGSGNMQDIKDLSTELAIIIQNRQVINN